MQHFHKFSVSAAILLFPLILSSCGNSKVNEMKQYKEEMESFFTAMDTYEDSLLLMDMNSEDAGEKILDTLTGMNEEILAASGTDHPEEYVNVQLMLEQSSEYMTDAVSYMQRAEEGDADAYDVAFSNYEKAMERIDYAITFLHGEVPEGVTMSSGEEVSGD